MSACSPPCRALPSLSPLGQVLGDSWDPVSAYNRIITSGNPTYTWSDPHKAIEADLSSSALCPAIK